LADRLGDVSPRVVVLEDEGAFADLVEAWLAHRRPDLRPPGGSDLDGSAPTPPPVIIVSRYNPQARSAEVPAPSKALEEAEIYQALVEWVDARVTNEHDMDVPAHICVGLLDMNTARREVRFDGAEVHLTPTELRLLQYLAEHSDRVVGHKELLLTVWGPGYGDDVHLLQVTMRSLRARLALVTATHMIETVYGAGYRMARPGPEGHEPPARSPDTFAGKQAPGTGLGDLRVHSTAGRLTPRSRTTGGVPASRRD
jgi:DNA-binding winged helix-turn-helix (wHTH) protein